MWQEMRASTHVIIRQPMNSLSIATYTDFDKERNKRCGDIQCIIMGRAICENKNDHGRTDTDDR
jgi:hypothetical protein